MVSSRRGGTSHRARCEARELGGVQGWKIFSGEEWVEMSLEAAEGADEEGVELAWRVVVTSRFDNIAGLYERREEGGEAVPGGAEEGGAEETGGDGEGRGEGEGVPAGGGSGGGGGGKFRCVAGQYYNAEDDKVLWYSRYHAKGAWLISNRADVRMGSNKPVKHLAASGGNTPPQLSPEEADWKGAGLSMYRVGVEERRIRREEDERGQWCDPNFPACAESIGEGLIVGKKVRRANE